MKKGAWWCGLCLLAWAGRGDLRFSEAGGEYRFDTGLLRGTLRSQGKSMGIGPVTECGTGVAVTGSLGLRRAAASGLAGVVMSPPEECFAVLMPYGEEGHRSLYLSLFGRDFRADEAATARARLVIGRNVSDGQVVQRYRAYLEEMKQHGGTLPCRERKGGNER